MEWRVLSVLLASVLSAESVRNTSGRKRTKHFCVFSFFLCKQYCCMWVQIDQSVRQNLENINRNYQQIICAAYAIILEDLKAREQKVLQNCFSGSWSIWFAASTCGTHEYHCHGLCCVNFTEDHFTTHSNTAKISPHTRGNPYPHVLKLCFQKTAKLKRWIMISKQPTCDNTLDTYNLDRRERAVRVNQQFIWSGIIITKHNHNNCSFDTGDWRVLRIESSLAQLWSNRTFNGFTFTQTLGGKPGGGGEEIGSKLKDQWLQ